MTPHETFPFTPSRDGELTNVIVSGVAAVDGADPIELSPPLSAAVDPDALESLFRNADDPITVTFRYRDRKIVVRSDGTVTIDDPTARE